MQCDSVKPWSLYAGGKPVFEVNKAVESLQGATCYLANIMGEVSIAKKTI